MGSDTTAGDATAGAEERRLEAARDAAVPWRRWGPYLSERQWGTVREDDSADGSAWESFPHDHARSRAYRWGEDGLAGFCDDKQRLCFALALWNGADPILKERLFGLTNGEGNHGEDVKEYYFYLDATPTSAYLKYLYKYPQVAYPYADLVATNRGRSRHEPEYELLDTGAFAEGRYFDVFVEYAKAAPEEILVRITVWNRGPEAAPLEVLPTLWFRNTWAAPEAPGPAVAPPGAPRPELRADPGAPGAPAIAAVHPELGTRYLLCEGEAPLLFTENETNAQRLFGTPNRTPFVKDGINDCVVGGRADAVNPAQTGTKAAARYRLTVAPGASATLRLRLTTQDPGQADRPDAGAAGAAPAGGAPFGAAFDGVVEARRREADAFYAALMPPGSGEDAALVMRQALAGMLWSAQYYGYDLDRWLGEHAGPPPGRAGGRNREWGHMLNDDVVSMPDKWEYPWYAAWDLAFHAVPLALADPDLAKRQLELLLGDRYQHPSGALPASEWAFDDVNPPVHAWAALFVYDLERERGGQGDRPFLRRVFHKLLLNFTWWVNRKDPSGRNVFQGGFLGLDNIGVFDRSAALPTGGHLEQADGTAWMAFYCQSMLAMALELANDDPVYEDLALKFFEHFLCDRRRDEPQRGRPGRAVGRGGRLLLRRPAPARRERAAPQGALPGGAAAPVRRDRPRGRRARALPGAHGAGAPLRRGAPRAGGEPRPRRAPRRRRAAPPVRPGRGQAPPGAGLPPGRGGVPGPPRHPRGLPRPRRPPLRRRRRGAGVPGGLRAGGVDLRPLRGQLQLAGPRLVPHQRPAHPGSAAALRLLRGRLHGGVPHRLGPAADAV